MRYSSTVFNLYFCTLSFEFGIFPDCLKTAKVIPIKAGIKTEINNYRSTVYFFCQIYQKPWKTYLYPNNQLF